VTGGLRFGVHSGQQYANVSELRALWRAAEDLGYDWVSLFDHFRPALGGVDGPCLEGTTTLAALAGATSRVRCAVLVTAVTWRHPAVAASIAATLDHLTGGRLEFGVGAGGFDHAYQEWGIRFPGPGQRLAMLDEACRIMRALWTGETTTFDGAHYRLRDARMAPKPVQQHLPLVVGGSGPRLLRVVAEHADVWNFLVEDVHAHRRRSELLDRYCGEIGRDPAAIRRSMTFRVVLGADLAEADRRRAERFAMLSPGSPDRREYLDAGTPRECVRMLGEFARAGVRDFLLGLRPPVDVRTLELFAAEVVPELRGAVSD
jgi:alkanesulfonate monooxygenase SsuD/methylene tetrahydromethanopterin reductase-like flavin-dependent oxidoreductase (luciferase family)